MDDRAGSEGWARAQEEQRRAWLRLTYEQRLRWLEQAMDFFRKALGAAAPAGRRSSAGSDWKKVP